MAELLLELLSEEIPARMQAPRRRRSDAVWSSRRARRTAGLDAVAQGRAPIVDAAPPRACIVDGLAGAAARSSARSGKGPRVGAPRAGDRGLPAARRALDARAMRAARHRQGRVLVRGDRAHRAGPPPRCCRSCCPTRSRRCPGRNRCAGPAARLRWVRPLHRIARLFDGERCVPLSSSARRCPARSTTTRAATASSRRRAFAVADFADYRRKLARRPCHARPAERARIDPQARPRRSRRALGSRVKPDEALLDEVTGLVEWPVVLLGTHRRSLHGLAARGADHRDAHAPEIFRAASTRTASWRRASSSSPTWDADDGGKAIVAGNERVLRARLSDAQFFWDQDRKRTLETACRRSKDIVFHAKLGTRRREGRRASRRWPPRSRRTIAGRRRRPTAARAARLAKADLATGMVGEFPELQGVMGRYYALARRRGRPTSPTRSPSTTRRMGPNDDCPTAPVSVAVALADKIDTLVGFFAIGEKPTGSKDPFALRRAALGVIRLILENRLRACQLLRRLRARPIAGSSGEHRGVEHRRRRPMRTTSCSTSSPTG